MTSNHQHVLALIENAVNDALNDISESELNTKKIIFEEVFLDIMELKRHIVLGMQEYLYDTRKAGSNE